MRLFEKHSHLHKCGTLLNACSHTMPLPTGEGAFVHVLLVQLCITLAPICAVHLCIDDQPLPWRSVAV